MCKKLVMLFSCLSVFFSNFAKGERLQIKPVEIYPKKLNKECGDGLAQIYDECGDQLDILNTAIQAAQAQNKNVLIVYGAEWCIWDHVFNNYVKGQFGKFHYKYRYDGELLQFDMRERITSVDYQQAKELNLFVSENFVIANIDAENTNGKDVLSQIGMLENIYYFPTIMVLDKNGKYRETMPSTGSIPGFQIRESGGEEYRGYNRKILLEQLRILKKLATENLQNVS